MTTYNTGNPVPSADARDRYDNSQTLDEVVNGDSASYETRTGKQVISLGGMNSRFNNAQDARESAFNLSQEEKQEAFQSFLDGTGWSSLGAYGAGVSITSHTQTVDYQGQPYQLNPSIPASLDAPYITTGVWATEGVNFKLVGDNSLRQDLGSDTGAGIVGLDGHSVSEYLAKVKYLSLSTLPAISSVANTVGSSVVLDADATIPTVLDINSRVSFAGTGKVLTPSTTGMTVLRISGTAPASFSLLAVDSLAGSTEIQTTLSLASGDWIEIRSETVLPAPNDQGVKYGQIVQVEQVLGGNRFKVSRALEYDFLVSATASCGVVGMRENITIENLVINPQDYSVLMSIPVWLKYAANVRIKNLIIRGTKVKGGADVLAASGLKINSCINVTIENITTEHIGWYGVEVLGPCQNIKVKNLTGFDCRHSFSVNWSEAYGEPCDVLVEDSFSNASTLTGFDTHDRGKRVRFKRCVSAGSVADSGFQLRASGAEAHNCTSTGNFYDGFTGRGGADGANLFNCVSRKNKRVGYNFPEFGANLYECSGFDNANSGAAMKGGLIRGGKWERNNFAFDCGTSDTTSPQTTLIIEDVDAPFSASQPRLMYFRGAQNRRPELVTLRNSRVFGYGRNITIADGGAYDAATPAPVSHGNQLLEHTSAVPTSGLATLVAGTFNVLTAASLGAPFAGTALAANSKIRLTLVAPGGTVGAAYISAVATGSGFIIKSTSATDTSTYKWDLEY